CTRWWSDAIANRSQSVDEARPVLPPRRLTRLRTPDHVLDQQILRLLSPELIPDPGSEDLVLRVFLLALQGFHALLHVERPAEGVHLADERRNPFKALACGVQGGKYVPTYMDVICQSDNRARLSSRVLGFGCGCRPP